MTPSTRDPRDPQYQRYLRAVAGAQRVLQERQVVENLESGQTVQLYLCYIGDGYLYGVSDNDAARSPSYWAGLDEDMDIVQATLPAAIAQDLLSFTNSEASSSVGDGYEAADLAAKHMQNDTVIYSSKGEAEDGMMESARVAENRGPAGNRAPRWNEAVASTDTEDEDEDEYGAEENYWPGDADHAKERYLTRVRQNTLAAVKARKAGNIQDALRLEHNVDVDMKSLEDMGFGDEAHEVESEAQEEAQFSDSLQESVEGSSLLIKEVARDLISMSVADALERENHDALSDFVRSQEDITETVPIGLQEHGIDIDSYIAPVEELVRQIAEQIGSENLGKLQDVDDRALWLVIMGPILNHGVGPTDDPALATVYKEVGSPRPQVKGLDVTLFNVAEDIISRISNGTSMLHESTEGNNRWEVIWLDVWGNAEEGFEVNDAHHTGRFVELPPEVAMGITEEEEQQLVDILIAAGELRRDVKAHQIEVEDLGEDLMSINSAATSEPLFQLQRVVEDQSAEETGEKVQEKLARQVMEIRMLAGGKFGIFDKSMRGAEPLAKANSWHEARMKINSMMRDAQKPLKD